jgi:hypothetical protein
MEWLEVDAYTWDDTIDEFNWEHIYNPYGCREVRTKLVLGFILDLFHKRTKYFLNTKNIDRLLELYDHTEARHL